MAYPLFTVLLLFRMVSAALATSWTFSHDNLLMTATDTESVNSVTVNSSLSRPSSGFLKKTVTSSSGAHAPANGSVLYGLEVPGLYYLQQPTLDNEGQIIYSVASGSCPTSNYNGIFVFGQWDPNGANDVTSSTQVGFGAFAWNNTTHTATISNMYNLSAFGSISTFSADVYFSSCSGGTFTAGGSGDRGGTMYMSSEGGAFFKTNANHGIMIVPQRQIPSGNALVGTYSVLRYDSVSNETIKTMRLVINAEGSSVSGNALTDPGDHTSTDGTFADVFTISALNSPMNGMVTGTLSHNGGASVNLACAVHLTSRNILFCAGQAPDQSSKPLNMALVSDAHPFVRASGFDNLVIAMDWDNTNHKLYVGGNFITYGSNLRRYIARFNSDGTIDSAFSYSGTGLTDPVFAIASVPSTGKVYVGGNFYEYDGNSVGGVARLNGDGSLDTAFVPPGSGFGSQVNSLAWDSANNRLYAGGNFTDYNGTTRKYVARLLTTGALDTAFTQTGLGFFNWVMSLAHDSSANQLYVGGFFNSYNGTTRNYIARLTAAGALDTNFTQTGTGLNTNVRAVIWDSANSKVYVGGDFTDYNGTSRPYVARLTNTGALDSGFAQTGTGLNGQVFSLAWDGSSSKLYVGGDFTSYNGTTRKRLARLNSDGSLDTNFVPASDGFNDYPRALKVDANGNVAIGGGFYSYGNIGIGHFTVLTSSGAFTTASSANLGFGFDASNTIIYGLTWSDATSRLFVSGDFTYFGGSPRKNIVKILPSGNPDSSFVTVGTGFGGGTYGTAYDATRDKLYVTGNFTDYNGTSVGRLARLNGSGSLDTAYTLTGTGFGDYTDRPVLDTTHNKLYVIGAFTDYNGTSLNQVARLNSDGTLDTAFATTGPGVGQHVYYLSLDTATNKVYIGGQFTTFGGNPRQYIARLNSDGSVDSAFTSTGTGFDSTVGYIEIDPATRKLYVGGDFTSYNGTPTPFMARLNTDGSLDSAFSLPGSGFDASVTSIALDTAHNKVYAGGYFTDLNGNYRRAVARLETDGSIDTDFDPGQGALAYDNYTIVSYLGWDSTNYKLYVGGNFSGFNDAVSGNLVRLTTTGALD